MATTRHSSEITRKRLINAAAEEIRRNGFRATSIDQILQQTGVTKGALYHHFSNKLELGYAVVEEVYRSHTLEGWGPVLQHAENPIDAILGILRRNGDRTKGDMLNCGCPLNNLAQEMAPVDEGFRARIEAVFQDWRNIIDEALSRGKENGTVRGNVDTEKTAIFIVSVVEGAIGSAKNAQDCRVLSACMEGLAHYLEALRPRISFRARVPEAAASG